MVVLRVTLTEGLYRGLSAGKAILRFLYKDISFRPGRLSTTAFQLFANTSQAIELKHGARTLEFVGNVSG